MLNLFVDEGATIYSNSIGVELDIRRDNFSLIPSITYTSYGFGDTLFRQKGPTRRQAVQLHGREQQPEAIYVGADLLWSKEISKNFSFEYGAGFGIGALFGSLTNDWVQDSGTSGPLVGSNGAHYSPCTTTTPRTANAGVQPAELHHTTPSPAKVNGYQEPNWFSGGSVPVIFPHIALPELGLRYKPIKQLETRVVIGWSLTGFFFGLSGDYGLPRRRGGPPPERRKTAERRRRGPEPFCAIIGIAPRMTAIPPRYEPIRRLGQGGGGEVWAVRDRITERVLALKVLAEGAGEDEVKALVREAVALSALEGLGVPRVVAFGSLHDGRRYMVRELVEGQSLEAVLDDEDGPDWIEPLARASEQLTVLHRAGLLHGDIKPANVIVGEGGAGTLVDLGLAAPWREGGTRARGLTPKFAAPELLVGEPLTVRAEVYALGATLAEGVARRGSHLDFETRIALAKIAARATESSQSARYPSVDELTSELRRAAGLRATPFREDAAWPVLGLDPIAQRLTSEAAALGPGEALAIEGPRGSGRSTLARRLAWTLGVEKRAVVTVEPPAGGMSPREAVELEIAGHAERGTRATLAIMVDDLAALDEAAKLVLSRASEAGARLVVVASHDEVRRLAKARTRAFVVPPLDARSADELVHRAVPSLPDALRAHLLERLEGRPGTLRAFVKKARGRAIVSPEDIDAVFAASSASAPPSSMNRADALSAIDLALERGRFDEVTTQIELLGVPRDAEERVRFAAAQARVVLARAETRQAAKLLDAVAKEAKGTRFARAWKAVRARTHLRAGEYAQALALADEVIAGKGDGLASDALSVRGLALAFTSEDAAAGETIERAVLVARAAEDKRAEAVALGSVAIVHQRAGRAAEAKRAYEASLAAAEAARDAWTYAQTRLNLAGLSQTEGDFAAALAHLEAAVDMGRRLGGGSAIQQALLNLANLDLYLGRFARASASIDSLAADRAGLGANARAQLLGLEAELAMRAGEFARGARLFDQCAAAWEAQARPMDAAEARLEGILGRARDPLADLPQLGRELATLRENAGAAGFREHEALAQIARGTLALLVGDETAARAALDAALAHATRAQQREWAWRALDARARLSASQGSIAIARRDTEQALAMLEETASKLPRDLREVFWDDPRRRALRQAHTATMPMPLSAMPTSSRELFTRARTLRARARRPRGRRRSARRCRRRTGSPASSRSRASWRASTTWTAYSRR